MEETLEFCQRVLGAGEPAVVAARDAYSSGASERVQLLAAASRACRSAPNRPPSAVAGLPRNGETLASAVARELACATARLPERQREALALRESSRLSYDQLSDVMGIGVSAVGPLLARARLRLREELRGAPAVPDVGCEERERALPALARRQDAETLSDADQHWLPEHIASCDACGRAHAAMLEASVCYRAWTLERTPGALEDLGARVAELLQPPSAAVPEPLVPEPIAPEPPHSLDHLPPEPAPSLDDLAPSDPAPPDPAPSDPAPPKHSWLSRLRAALAADARR